MTIQQNYEVCGTKVIDNKGNKFLVKFKNGLYAIEKQTKSVGRTLHATLQENEIMIIWNKVK